MRQAWLDVDLRHLKTFVTLAEERSFRATATRLGFAQSAISQHIATLEQRVGERLVERSPGARLAELTPAGDALLGHARAILARVAVAERDFQQQGRAAKQRVRIGVFQSVSGGLVAPLLARIASAETKLAVELVENGLPIELLVAGKVDLAFSEAVPTTDIVQYVEIMKDPFVLLTPRTVASVGSDTTLEHLATMPLLTYEASCHLRAVSQELARTTGVALQSRIRSNDILTLQSLVAHGAGFALVPQLALTSDDPRLVATPIAAVRPRSICLSWHAERTLTRAMRQLIDAFVAAGVKRTRQTVSLLDDS